MSVLTTNAFLRAGHPSRARRQPFLPRAFGVPQGVASQRGRCRLLPAVLGRPPRRGQAIAWAPTPTDRRRSHLPCHRLARYRVRRQARAVATDARRCVSSEFSLRSQYLHPVERRTTSHGLRHPGSPNGTVRLRAGIVSIAPRFRYIWGRNDHRRPERNAVVVPQYRVWMHVFPRYQTPLEPPRLRDMSPTYRIFRPSALPIVAGTTSGIPPLCALVRSGLGTGAVGMLTARYVTSPSESQRCLESPR